MRIRDLQGFCLVLGFKSPANHGKARFFAVGIPTNHGNAGVVELTAERTQGAVTVG